MKSNIKNLTPFSCMLLCGCELKAWAHCVKLIEWNASLWKGSQQVGLSANQQKLVENTYWNSIVLSKMTSLTFHNLVLDIDYRGYSFPWKDVQIKRQSGSSPDAKKETLCCTTHVQEEDNLLYYPCARRSVQPTLDNMMMQISHLRVDTARWRQSTQSLNHYLQRKRQSTILLKYKAWRLIPQHIVVSHKYSILNIIYIVSVCQIKINKYLSILILINSRYT